MPTQPLDRYVDPTHDEIEQAARWLVSGEFGRAMDAFTDTDAISSLAWVTSNTSLVDDHAAVFDAWKAAERDGRVDHSSISPDMFRAQLGKILILDVLEEGFDGRYRLYGTKVSDACGRDWTGSTVSELNRTVQTGLGLYFRSCYRAVAIKNAPLLAVHRSPHWIAVEQWSRLILPLHAEDGGLSRFLVSNLPINQREMTQAQVAKMEERVRRRQYPSSLLK